MQPLLLVVSLILCVNGVWAGGYAGALERVWLYYAYRIDQFNDPADQTMGVRCMRPKGKKWNFVDPTSDKQHFCPPDAEWRSCASERNRGEPCSFKQLLDFMGAGNLAHQGDPVPAGAIDQNKPPVQETAVRYHDERMTEYNAAMQKHQDNPQKFNEPKKPIPNFPIYNFLSTDKQVDWNEGMKKIGDRTVATLAAKKGQSAKFVDGFREATNKIKEARLGDHGPYLIEEAKLSDWAKEISIITKKVGPGESPIIVLAKEGEYSTKKAWETIDWDETLKGSKLSTEDAWSKIKPWMDKFYVKGSDAWKHKVLLEGYDDVARRATIC